MHALAFGVALLLLLTTQQQVGAQSSDIIAFERAMAQAEADIRRSPYGASIIDWFGGVTTRYEQRAGSTIATAQFRYGDGTEQREIVWHTDAWRDPDMARIGLLHEYAHHLTWAYCRTVPDAWGHIAIDAIVATVAQELAWNDADYSIAERLAFWPAFARGRHYDWQNCIAPAE